MSETTMPERPAGVSSKFLRLPLTRILLAVAPMFACLALVHFGANALHLGPRSAPGVGAALLGAAGVVAIYAAEVRFLEGRRLTEFAREGAGRELLAGGLLGAALFSATMAVLWPLGAWSLEGVNGPLALAYPLASAAIAACVEELLFRGVFFRMAEEGLGSWLALGLSAALFGLVHGFNPGATTVSTLAIALEAGVLLGAAYMYTRRLWLPIGVHLAWNFTEGGVFGCSVSGGEAHGLLRVRFHGADALTGGQFGPEASAVAVSVCLLAAAALVVLARRAHHVVQPFWRRPKARPSA